MFNMTFLLYEYSDIAAMLTALLKMYYDDSRLTDKLCYSLLADVFCCSFARCINKKRLLANLVK